MLIRFVRVFDLAGFLAACCHISPSSDQLEMFLQEEGHTRNTERYADVFLEVIFQAHFGNVIHDTTYPVNER